MQVSWGQWKPFCISPHQNMTTPKHLLKLIRLPPKTPLHQYLLLEEALLRESPHSYLLLLDGTDREYVVSGVGNKPEEWLNQDFLHRNRRQFPVLKRYTGGGSVVTSPDTLFVSFVFSRALLPPKVQLFPRPIMRWSEKVYKDVFGHNFQLLEYDYVWKMDEQQREESQIHSHQMSQYMVDELNEDLLEKDFFPQQNGAKSSATDSSLNDDPTQLHPDREKPKHSSKTKKFGGNAQYMTGGKKQRFCHHTSFLWDYDQTAMNACLQLPSKKPDYRENRSHDDFLIRMKDMKKFKSRKHFFESVERRIHEMAENEWKDTVEIHEESMEEAMEFVEKNKIVGTRFIDPLTGEKLEEHP